MRVRRALATAARALEAIPGVGPSIARDLHDLGYCAPEDLRGKDPELMFERLCAIRGRHIDRCVLYVFRSAVYFVTEEVHDPHLLKWWNWKSRRLALRPLGKATDRAPAARPE